MTIDRIAEISYIDFFCNYLLPNKPCIITEEITRNWRSRTEWTTTHSEPKLKKLSDLFGHLQVPVVMDEENADYNNAVKSQMSFRTFLEQLAEDDRANQDRPALKTYLKDWHFTQDVPDYEAYSLPIYFRNDWMNEYWDIKGDPVERDYRFLYMGDKGTWTPFHADVFRSYSWSANICGKKLWYLVPPAEESKILNMLKSSSAPNLRTLASHTPIPAVEVVQNAGEIIFVPSNWFHEVHNLELTISVNHNWCNGANIAKVCDYLLERLDAVHQELADCRSIMTTEDWYQQCQVILRCDIGMNFEVLTTMLKTIAERRIRTMLETDSSVSSIVHCAVCNVELSTCQRSTECLESLKINLKQRCACNSGAEQCNFCISFFSIFDLLSVISCLQRVMLTRDAECLTHFCSNQSNMLSSFQEVLKLRTSL